MQRLDAKPAEDKDSTVFVVIPVFGRLNDTLNCLKLLEQQTYRNMKIIVSDGGSKDGSVQKLESLQEKIDLLTTKKNLWWSGSMAAGISRALQRSKSESDFVLMMNNDTHFASDYVETLVSTSRRLRRVAVGAINLDAGTKEVLDAGVQVQWKPYSFPVKNKIDENEEVYLKADVLPGRGSLVPIELFKDIGNIKYKTLPHYIADYEFFYRAKRNGHTLAVTYKTSIQADMKTTGLSFDNKKKLSIYEWMKLSFSRRSMINVLDHLFFIFYSAPSKSKISAMAYVVRGNLNNLFSRTLPGRGIYFVLGIFNKLIWSRTKKIRIFLNKSKRWIELFVEFRRTFGIDKSERIFGHFRRFSETKITFESMLTLFSYFKSEEDLSSFERVLGLMGDQRPNPLFNDATIANIQFMKETKLLRAPLLELQNRNWQFFSQEGEDLILSRLLSKEKGFYVDIGAHHPYRFSNTQFFYSKGWSGLNVEPDIDGFELLQKYRPRDINLNVGVLEGGEQKSEAPFYRFFEPALNSFDRTYASEMESKGCKLREVVSVPFEGLASLLQKYCSNQEIDVMSIDCEGSDKQIIFANDWAKWRPKVLVVEILSAKSRIDQNDEIVLFLNRQGYEVHSVLVNSWIFVETSGKK